MSEPRPPVGSASGSPSGSPEAPLRARTSGWWFLLAPGLLALGALVAGTLVLVALGAAGRSIAEEPTIPAGDTGVLEVAAPGEFVVFVRYRTSVGGQPIDEPQVVVLAPDGGALDLEGPDPTQGWSDGDGELVALGDLTTSVAGPHRVVVGPAATDLIVGIVVAPDPLVGVVGALGWALGVVVVSVIAAVVAVVVVALRRRGRAPASGGADPGATPPR